MTNCEMCHDVIYEFEFQATSPEVHEWCLALAIGMTKCRTAMIRRKALGLPTPSSPMWVEPNVRGS